MNFNQDYTNYYQIDTPEGVAIQLPVAGLWSRSGAWLIDLLIRFMLYIVFAIALSLFGLFGQGVMLIIIFTLEWFYPVFYEVLGQGQTPGKKILAIKVIQMNGSHLSWGSSMTRNILRFIDMLPLAYGVGFVAVISTRNFQRIGDLVANTIVIHCKQAPALHQKKFDKENISINSKVYQLITNLKSGDRSALISYHERLNDLSNDRQEELARILSPLLIELGLKDNAASLEALTAAVLDKNESI